MGSRLAVALLAASLGAGASSLADAHHGWTWAEDEFFELKGTISKVSITNPHAMIDVTANGEEWRVELAAPGPTARAGFTAESAKGGDEITAIGNRSKDKAERRMKAVRIVVGGKTYDVYPGRVPK
jgi:hypothetical protein